MAVTLEQTPLVEAALMAIDNHTGQIKAMVGGWSFSRSKFNRAVQAYRQLGSTFKPIVYTTAIDRGFTPTSIIVDAPVTYPSGNGQIYARTNYDHKFQGPITLRYALEESRNIPAIKMMDTLGPKTVLEYAKRFGFEEDFPPYLPIALGAGDATLHRDHQRLHVVPESGRADEAVLGADGEGSRGQPARGESRRAERRHPRRHRLRDDEHAEGRAEHARHRRPRRQAGRRNGRSPARPAPSTTTPTRGSSASIRTSPSACGSATTTSASRSAPPNRDRFVALPMWMEFMQRLHRRPAPTRTIRRNSRRPGNIVFLPVDHSNGTVITAETPGAVHEAFIAGTQPGAGAATFGRQP